MTETNTRDRIVRCALAEVEKNGIVGLRVADVAASADVSVPLIYKYFRDRDGLLATVLSETITRSFMQDIEMLREVVNSSQGPVDAAKLAKLMPMPGDEHRKRNRRIRTMAIAASYDIPALAKALAANQQLMNDATNDLIDAVRKQSGCTSNIPTVVVTMTMQALALGLIVNDGFTETAISDSDYQRLITELLNLLVVK
jgi:AcrR family transcriptional regulator